MDRNWIARNFGKYVKRIELNVGMTTQRAPYCVKGLTFLGTIGGNHIERGCCRSK